MTQIADRHLDRSQMTDVGLLKPGYGGLLRPVMLGDQATPLISKVHAGQHVKSRVNA